MLAPSNLWWLLARCASTHHEGLEQTFNSLDAQREAYVAGIIKYPRIHRKHACPSIFHSFNCWMIAHLLEKLLACATSPQPGLSRQNGKVIARLRARKLHPAIVQFLASTSRPAK
jgi:hypothetical protein